VLAESPERNREQILVLRTYAGQEHDGLTSVFARVSDLGEVVDDTRGDSGHPVLVAGLPFQYSQRLSPRNRNIVYTTFETSQLPPHWVNSINGNYHECVVPHQHVARVFVNSGVRIPVRVVQLGFTRYPGDPVRRPPADVFRVGFMGVPVRRKNLHKLFAACLELREEIPSLRLAVHVATYYEWLNSANWNDIKSAGFVEWSEGVLSPQEVAAWYRRLSCYVYPSSAEGWSFTPRESVCLGVPTALSAIPIHADLIDSGFCTAIPVRGVEPATYEGGVYGAWDRVEVDDIVRALKDIHESPDAVEQRARDGAHWIANRWRNAETRQGLVDVLRSA